jgi:hypothetical protein
MRLGIRTLIFYIPNIIYFKAPLLICAYMWRNSVTTILNRPDLSRHLITYLIQKSHVNAAVCLAPNLAELHANYHFRQQ